MNQFLILISICLTGYILGKLLTERPDMAPAERFPAFDRKPFNCRPCLTFHLIWIFQAITAILLKSVAFFAAGLGCAVVIFIALHVDAKNKIDE